MRVFLTGATGFIGSRIVPELIAAGHTVSGLTRSDDGARMLAGSGAEVHRGTLEDPDSLREGARQADAVIHTAFDHDFSRFVENCEKDRRAVTALGEALEGTAKPILITSGTGIGSPGPGLAAREDVFNPNHPNPRIASEEAGRALQEKGIDVRVVRLPQVHDTFRQGLISPYIDIARANGMAAYLGDGENRWPAAHVLDVAKLYVLALDRGRSGARYHAVAEEGITARAIAEIVASGLRVPAVSIPAREAEARLGWFAAFARLDMPASSEWTRAELDWHPHGRDLVTDLKEMDYASA